MNIGKKLGFSFGSILLIFLLSAFVNFLLIESSIKIQKRLADVRLKTVVLGKDIETGIQASLASLRGYMILGADPTKAQSMQASRKKAWQNIDNAIKSFNKLSKNWTIPANVSLLKNLESTLEEFRLAQQEIEDISHIDANIPAYDLLLKEAAPRASLMLNALNKLIDEEETLKANKPRKQLLKYLADTRGSFAIGLANIRAYLLSGNAVFHENFINKWLVNEQRYQDIMKNKHLFTPSQLSNWNQYVKIRHEFSTFPSKMFELRAAKDWNKANYYLGTKAAPKAKQAYALLTKMRSSQDKLMRDDISLLHNTNDNIKLTITILTVLSIIVGIILATLITRNILSRLEPVVEKAKRIANNDLTGNSIREEGGDEITQLTHSINEMSNVLNNVIGSTVDSMSELANGSNDIKKSNDIIAEDITSANEQVNLIAAAIEELTASAHDVSQNCLHASINAEEALKLVTSGGEQAKSSVTHMNSIKHTFTSSSKSITTLNEKSQQIENIVNVIKSIADQTNLLALNAAIEAARAGEQGRGFAVVADEVRQLASRTTQATSEVESAISSIQTEIHSAVTVMEEGNKKVEDGFTMATNTQESLDYILSSINGVTSQIQTIASTAKEQSLVTEEIAKNADTILQATSHLQVNSSNIKKLIAQVNTEASDKVISLRNML